METDEKDDSPNLDEDPYPYGFPHKSGYIGKKTWVERIFGFASLNDFQLRLVNERWGFIIKCLIRLWLFINIGLLLLVVIIQSILG